MKFRIYISILFLFMVVALPSCKDDDSPTLRDIAFQLLAGNWSVGTQGSIVLDGEDISLNYPGFTLSFADGTYQTTNGSDLFRANGTWEWTDTQGTVLTLDTGEEVTINTLSLNEFEFSFFHAGSSRAGIQGNYVITVFK